MYTGTQVWDIGHILLGEVGTRVVKHPYGPSGLVLVRKNCEVGVEDSPGAEKLNLDIRKIENVDWLYEDESSVSDNGHDRNPLRLLRNATHFVPKQTVEQWKLCQRASTCTNVPIMTIVKIK